VSLRRIGLFGGSFDPPHNAHLALAQVALEHLSLDELRWIPAGQQWQKTRELASAEDRAAMVSLAIAGEPRFVLEPCELQRAGPSYTLDTVNQLQPAAGEAEWFLIIGQDQYARLHTWHGWTQLLRKVTFAVACRDTESVSTRVELSDRPHTMLTLPLPRMEVSSTAIRQAIAEGRDFTDMVPAAVARYIAQHRLYTGNPRS
jgi:nicotinate-nucleotide adenylyltransferase